MISFVIMIVVFLSACVSTANGQIGTDGQPLEPIETVPVKSYRVDSSSRPAASSVATQTETQSADAAPEQASQYIADAYAEADANFSYKGEPIHPSLVCEFLTSLADKGIPLTVSVDVAAAFDTNEYYYSAYKDENGAIVCENKDKNTTDGYRWYGRLADGSHIVYVWEDDGSRMLSRSIFFIQFSMSKGVMPDGTAYDRLLMTATRWYIPFDARSKVTVSDDIVVITMDGEDPIILKTPDVPGDDIDEEIRDGLSEVTKYFTCKGQPIHPGIIKEFTGYISDHGFPISVSIDLAAAAGSNEYFDGDIEQPVPGIYKVNTDEGQGSFSYERCGSMNDGTIVVRTSDWGGGSGVFKGLYFLRCTAGKAYMPDGSPYNQLLLTAVRWFPLGDRSKSEVQVFPDKVVVGPGASESEPVTLYMAK